MPVLTLIALPDNFVASTTATASTIFSDLSPVVYLIGGVLLAAVVIELIIGAIKH